MTSPARQGSRAVDADLAKVQADRRGDRHDPGVARPGLSDDRLPRPSGPSVDQKIRGTPRRRRSHRLQTRSRIPPRDRPGGGRLGGRQTLYRRRTSIKVNKKTEQFEGATAAATTQDEALTQLKESAAHTFDVLRKFAPPEPTPVEPTPVEATPPVEPTPEAPAEEPVEENIDLVVQKIADADASLTHLEGLKLPNFVALGRYIPLMTFLTAALAGGLGFGIGWIAGGVIGVVLGGVGAFFLRKALVAKAKTQVAQEYFPLQKSFVEIEALIARIRQKALAEHAEKDAAALAKREQELQKIETKKTTILTEAQKRRDAAIAQASEAHATAVADIDKKREEQLKAILEKYTAAVATIKAASEEGLAKADREYQQGRQAIQTVYERDWKTMADRWRAGIDHVKAEETDLNSIANHYSPCRDGSEWEPRSEIPPLLRVGEFRLDLKAIQGGIPKDPTLKPEAPEAVILPAMIPFPEMGCLMVKAPASARDQAAKVLQAAMLRLLMSVPPAKVRFTIFDPVGLGRNFAAFMHLVDFDEALVASRIWTEPAQIDQRLTRPDRAHGERHPDVPPQRIRLDRGIQRDGRRGRRALPRPRRSDLPGTASPRPPSEGSSASPRAAPRCGVYVLMSASTPSSRTPPTSSPRISSRAASTWLWKRQPVLWKGARSSNSRSGSTSRPRPSSTGSSSSIGDAAKKAKRVEVPFEVIAPTSPTSTGPGTAGASSTSPSAAPAPPSSRTSSSARGPRSTSSSPARPAPVSRRSCTR